VRNLVVRNIESTSLGRREKKKVITSQKKGKEAKGIAAAAV